MQEKDEQAETFNEDQREMFQNPDTKLGETRPRTPGTQNAPPAPSTADDDKAGGDVANQKLDNPDLL
ncbi:MAG TPA: hypothetical protein VK363_19005 [Pyrinomonadaceae bacterium]|nr:hypothetical protein [Pyrinomonadaceae bacterium]